MGAIQGSINNIIGTTAVIGAIGAKLNPKIDKGFLEQQQALEQKVAQQDVKIAQQQVDITKRRIASGELKTNRQLTKAMNALTAAQRANESLMSNGRAAFDARNRGRKK